ncbi:MAG: methylenetetrahydrofolate--tRNA-(uracil(54)-C(5))-methyltransferase (FADH(2)-oxidizing) TrmFO [Polyangiaceae bacterium]|nr:methylenetetrahydrofolate--tRNA-(uracil(54)-C(5))-methyltransferase (FADH(2)-oxidizing) TrmFO [Polyangiaceae bacterium]MCW5791809.1 methylenetetrahydrofolate--tRNA-(uracil(54)-C(5))-methyltransferase (FADH(2)-oxidizing) TrmFO [Polyangiaceae bacterium]
MAEVTLIGAGLAGSEAALQLAARGVQVRLLEQKPERRTPAQSSDHLCELVCSNSFRGAHLTNAVGLLKEEMRRLGSQVMQAAELCRVPAGGALAVDRERFAAEMTRRLNAEPNIQIITGEVSSLPSERPLVVATGPLTGDALAASLEARLGEGSLAYYDAIAPIVSADSIDWDRVFIASRWDKGETEEERRAYVNCPMDREQYERFVAEIQAARKVEPRAFEQARYFEGCLPVEVMAERGVRTLAFGPMKPAGLTDPRTGRWPYAVVQLRREDEAGTAYNLVGFQSRMAWPEQERIFRTIPGLEQAEFLRLGAVHRNTFLCAPRLLDETMQLRAEPGLYFAGQITGTEGYVEGAAGGWLVAHFIAERLAGREPRLPPDTTAHAALLRQLSRHPEDYQPSNITFSHFAPFEGVDARGRKLRKRDRYQAMADRALADLAPFAEEVAP